MKATRKEIYLPDHPVFSKLFAVSTRREITPELLLDTAASFMNVEEIRQSGTIRMRIVNSDTGDEETYVARLTVEKQL